MSMKNYSYDQVDNLVKKAKEGNESSINQVIEILTPYITSLCKNVWISNYETEDLYQECVKSLLEAMTKYKIGEKTFISFATIAIRNNLYCILRKRVKEKFQTPIEKVEFILSYNVDFDKNLEEAEKAKLIDNIKKAFHHLKPEYKEILLHYYFEDKKLNDFITNKDPYSLKRNALINLKKEFANLNY